MFSKSKDSAIRLLNFSQNLGDKEIISSTTQSFPKGEICVLVGKQEISKSHLLRSIGGFEECVAGDIVTCGKSARNSGADYKRNVFLVSPYIQFNLPCTLSHIPGILMGFYENWDFISYKSWLEHFGLNDNTPYSQLSVNSRMKALTAIAMACGADVLLFEDIDSFLTSEDQKTLLSALQMKKSIGVTTILGSKRLTRWINSDVEMYSFKNTNLIRVDTELLKKRVGISEATRPILPAKDGWTRQKIAEENTATMTMTFVAS